MENFGLGEILFIGGIGAICALPLIAGAIALVVMLARRGKKREASLSIGDER